MQYLYHQGIFTLYFYGHLKLTKPYLPSNLFGEVSYLLTDCCLLIYSSRLINIKFDGSCIQMWCMEELNYTFHGYSNTEYLQVYNTYTKNFYWVLYR